MNGISVLFLFFIYFLVLVFVIGAIILLIGLLRKESRNSTIKKGFIITGVPVGLALIAFTYSFLNERFIKKPTEEDLCGVYHITNASGLISSNSYNSYKLEFKKDKTFHLSQVPNIKVCETGSYSVNWQSHGNELVLQCNIEPRMVYMIHIDNGFSGFKIDFVIGDPDEGKHIYFTKDN